MTNRISDYFDEDDEDQEHPLSPLPTEDDRVLLVYQGQGKYAVLLHDPNIHYDGFWGASYLGPLGDALKVAERLLTGLNRTAGQTGEVADIWREDMVDIILPDTDYRIEEDLTPGEIYWWVECNQYGPYPGDDWYHQKMDEEDSKDLDDLNE